MNRGVIRGKGTNRGNAITESVILLTAVCCFMIGGAQHFGATLQGRVEEVTVQLFGGGTETTGGTIQANEEVVDGINVNINQKDPLDGQNAELS